MSEFTLMSPGPMQTSIVLFTIFVILSVTPMFFLSPFVLWFFSWSNWLTVVPLRPLVSLFCNLSFRLSSCGCSLWAVRLWAHRFSLSLSCSGVRGLCFSVCFVSAPGGQPEYAFGKSLCLSLSLSRDRFGRAIRRHLNTP